LKILNFSRFIGLSITVGLILVSNRADDLHHFMNIMFFVLSLIVRSFYYIGRITRF